jgi:hypothetical protein
VVLIHSQGMMSVKVTELTPELREQLGYPADRPNSGARNPAGWVKQEIAKLPLAQVTQVEQRWSSRLPVDVAQVSSLSPRVIGLTLGVALAVYLCFCYCAMLICQKSGSPPGGLIWVPFLQAIPLLRAANMSPWWLMAGLVPLLNLVVQMVWSVRIVQARGKSLAAAVFLHLPITALFAFLYLAFSDSAPPKEERVVEVMTLEAA